MGVSREPEVQVKGRIDEHIGELREADSCLSFRGLDFFTKLRSNHVVESYSGSKLKFVISVS